MNSQLQTNETVALILLAVMAVTSLYFLDAEAKDIVLAIAAGIIGYISKTD